MAYVTVPGGLYLPAPLESNVFAGTGAMFTAFLLDATAEKIAFILRATKAGNISNVGFLLGTVTTGDTLRVSLQDVDIATGSPDGTADQSGTVVVADTDDNVWKTVTLGASRTVAVGEIFAVVIDFNSWVAGALNINGHTGLGGGSRMPFINSAYCSHFTAAWAKSVSTHPNVAIGYDDGTYAGTPGALPVLAQVSQAYNSGTAARDEVALKFKLPFAYKINGAYVMVDPGTGAAFDIVLYDSDGSTVLASASVDGDQTPENGSAAFAISFAEQTLVKDTFYRLAVKPTSVTNVSVRHFTVDTAAHLDGHTGGQNFHYSDRVDAGAWTDILTQRPAFGLIVSALDNGVGGAGGGLKLAGRGGLAG